MNGIGRLARTSTSQSISAARRRGMELRAMQKLSIESLSIPEVKLVVPQLVVDERGSFCEIFNAARLASAGIEDVFVQDNASMSKRAGTLRGLHFQRPPHAQAKIVRVTRGSILDIAVDLRRNSPTFRHHVAAKLSAKNRVQLYVPVGFAHGFLTLENDTEVFYKVSHPYEPGADGGVFWADPDLAIDWPITPDRVTLSAKDAALPRLDELANIF